MRRWLVTCLFVGACGGGNGDGPIPLEGLAAAYHSYQCNQFVRCGLVEDLATCMRVRPVYTLDGRQIAAAEAGELAYDGAAAGICFAGLFASCDRSLQFSDRSTPEACEEMFTGTLDAGTTCGIDEECLSGSCSAICSPYGTCAAGVAAVRPSLGDACATDPHCLASYCDSTGTGTCVPYLALGAACTTDAQCAPGLACPGGTCAPLAATGAACTYDYDCRNIGDYCGPSHTCVAYGLSGDVCGGGLACARDDRCVGTACMLRPMTGDPCSAAAAPADCIDDSYCAASTCLPLKPDGSPCASSAECVGGLCDATAGAAVCATAQACY